MPKSDNQEKVNERARKIGAKINSFNGYVVIDKEGNRYYVEKHAHAEQVLSELEKEQCQTTE
jgi:hypothetical protein